MRICYVLLSPTFGMHQYTADIANRVALAGQEVCLVTTARFPRDRYRPDICVRTPINTSSTGFSTEGLRASDLGNLESTITSMGADVVHFTGPHLWNVPLVYILTGRGIPVVHTIHDLNPHSGTHFGLLQRSWNSLILRRAHHILVHGETFRDRLIEMGLPPERLTLTPLLFLPLSSARLASLASEGAMSTQYQRWALFFGRLERYKGVDHLLTACAMMNHADSGVPRVILAGPGNLDDLWAGPLPEGVKLYNRLIQDEEAVDLFRRCGLVVLPYQDATQSAIVATAYYFRKPVVVTRTGALPEYVEDGQTGRVVEPSHPASLARCLEEMLADPVRLAQMGSAGRTWYDAYRAAEMSALLEMYQQVARRSQVPATHQPEFLTIGSQRLVEAGCDEYGNG